VDASAATQVTNILKPVIAVWLVLGLLSFACANRPPDRVPEEPTAPPTAAQERPYGVSLSFGYDQLPEHAFQLAREAGIGWVRAVLNWNIVEPAPGRYDWRVLDRIVGYARSHGLRMIGGLGYATSWNTTAPPTEINQGRRLMYPPADLETWKRYVTNIVTRYKDVVRAWEVWNEPDLQAFWVGTAAQYAELLAVTYETVKRADPTATVLLGGLALGGSPGRLNSTFLEEILADPVYPAAQYFDVAAFHHYGSRGEAQRRWEYVKGALTRVGAASKEIWITETGYTSNPAEQELPQYQGGPSAQARWLEDTLPYLFQLGAARVCWFQLMDNPRQEPRAAAMGLLDTSAQPKPAYDAYKNLINDTAPRPTGRNPFGLMLPSRLVRSSQGMQIAKALGAVYYRPSSALFLNEWNGTCPECAAALAAGFRLVLTVRANGRGQATAPPSDLAAYQRTLSQVLDTYRPAILVVENEENSALFYTGTSEEYA
jgi:hypothetical protein